MSLAKTGARNYAGLLADIAELHTRRSPRSHRLAQESKRYLVDGGSHTLRLVQPFAPRIVAARGARVRDEDGHDILDFWQGHLGNVLGHNPELVTAELARALGDRFGLQTGCSDRLESEVAQLLCHQTGAERVRFTTSGTLANTYAVMLAQAWTGRDRVMKVGGGWHGAHPHGLKGVHYREGFAHAESEGLPREVLDRVIVTGFNDLERLGDDFRRYGDRLACFTVEPMLGAGGMIPATREYLRAARELADHHGALLVFDEVITGFRFRAGDAGRLYGVRPDLMVFGKAIGGGMPVAAVAGRADLLELAGRASRRVAFSGGTYSSHPGSLLAARAALRHLVERAGEIYPQLARIGAELRSAIESAFAEEGMLVRCTGHHDEVLGGSSLFFLHFPYREDTVIDSPDVAFDPAQCDVELGRDVLEGALLLEDVLLIHAHGAASTAHAAADVGAMAEACRRAARRIKAA